MVSRYTLQFLRIRKSVIAIDTNTSAKETHCTEVSTIQPEAYGHKKGKKRLYVKKTILITGHRNPDTDSICAASAYAILKNRINVSENNFKAVRCGNVSEQTKFVFKTIGFPIPDLISDVRPRARSVARTNVPSVTSTTSIFSTIQTLDLHNLSVLPVIEPDGNYLGIVSSHEISTFFIHENLKKRPRYLFHLDNFTDVIPGEIIKEGEKKDLLAPIMVGAMPYETSIERFDALQDIKPLFITGFRIELLKFIVKQDIPVIVLTGCSRETIDLSLFDEYKGTLFISHTDTADTVRRLRLSVPVRAIMNREPESVSADDYYSDAKMKLTNSTYRGLPVMEGDKYCGVISRRCFIEKPKTKLIMVDHNEMSQSIAGADEAEIIEIIDHHRLGATTTAQPIFIDVEPVGSTCTIIHKHYTNNGIVPNKEEALLMLSGILSDTIVLKSPTTTERDIRSAHELASIGQTTVDGWGEELFAHTASLKSDNYTELLMADIKIYNEHGYTVGISQVEVTSFGDYDNAKVEIEKTLIEITAKEKLDWAMLLITNIINEESILIVTPHEKLEERLVYQIFDHHSYYLKGVLSRKKQLLPEILRVLKGES